MPWKNRSRLEEDLAVGDRDHVGRNVGRHVVRLRLDDGQRRQRTAAIGVVQFRGALEQARMQIEHVAGIGFAARRTAEQQRHLAIGDGLLRKIIIDDQRVHAVVAEPFAHGAAGERREILQRRRIARGGGDDDRVFHRARVFERLDDLRDRRALLADGDIDAIELLLLVAALIDGALIDDRVDGDGGLAGLAVADDQLALAAADRDEAVDGLDARLHRLVHGFARNDARRLHVDAAAFGDVLEFAFAVDRIAEAIDARGRAAPCRPARPRWRPCA